MPYTTGPSCWPIQSADTKMEKLCFAGAEKLHLEMYLCVVQDRCSSARLMLSTPSLHEYNISVVLELV